jgi:hypothetical protein
MGSSNSHSFIGTQRYLLSTIYSLSRKGCASEVVVPRTLVEDSTGTLYPFNSLFATAFDTLRLDTSTWLLDHGLDSSCFVDA